MVLFSLIDGFIQSNGFIHPDGFICSVRSDDDHAAHIKTLTKKIQCKSSGNVSHLVVHKPNEIVRLSEWLKWSRFMTEAVWTYVIVSFQPAKEK